MKKTLIKLVATTLLALSLSSCEKNKGNNDNKEHVHNYDVENIEWFWKQLQNKDYEAKATFSCLDCKEDVEGHSVTLDATVNKAETKHATCQEKGKYTYTAKVTFQEHEYSATREREFEDVSAHHYIEVKDAQYLKTAADCENDAVYFKSCEFCHEKNEETFVDVGTKLGHDLIHHDAQTPTCQQNGNIEYWQCSRCNKYFLSETGEAVNYSEIDLGRSHNMTKHDGTPATCTADGTADYYTCEYEPEAKYYDLAGEHLVENDADLVIPASGHNFDGTLHCLNCHETFKDCYSLENATMSDGLVPLTINDLGIANGTTVPNHSTASHIFANYDFATNKGIDLWFKVDYQYHSEDSWGYFYLFNAENEDGITFRFQYNRNDDGVLPLYIYKNFDYGSNSTVVTGAGNPGTIFYFPKSSGIKSTEDVIFHVVAICIDEATNLFRCTFTGGITGGIQYYPTTNQNDITNTPLTFDIELGANYFDTKGKKIRFSSTTSDLKLYNCDSQEQMIVYKDFDGTLIGKSNGSTIHVTNYEKENKKLVGWIDHNGKKVTDGQEITSKTIVQPYFVDKQTDMIVPSDIQMCGKGTWFDVNSTTITGETPSQIGYLPSDNQVDLYFIYESTAFLGADNWSRFGFPYDFIDEKSRLFIRINENDNGRFDGYIYGASLGTEGDLGTYYNLGHAFRRTGDQILIHISVVDNGSNNITFTLEATNLRTRESNSKDYSVTFNQYSSSEGETRNKMALIPAVNCEWRFIDAF